MINVITKVITTGSTYIILYCIRSEKNILSLGTGGKFHYLILCPNFILLSLNFWI